MLRLKYIVIYLLIYISTPFAQINLNYGSTVYPLTFRPAESEQDLCLPVSGKFTLFHFMFAKEKNIKVIDYLSCLQSFSTEILIHHILSEGTKDTGSVHLPLLKPMHPDQLQPLWEIYLNTKENPILLVDRNCKVVFCGILDSPENFNQILERLGIDFSLQQNVTFESFLTEYATLLQFKTGRTIDEQSYVKSKNSKIVLLYRSFCVPCGEDLLIKEILKYRNSVRPKTLDYICIFRRIGEKENLQLDEILESSDPDFMHIYEAQKPNPAIERFFLKGNPLLLIFDAEIGRASCRERV